MANPRKAPELRQRGARTRDIGLVAAPEAGAVVVPDPPPGLLKDTRAVWDDLWHSRASATIDLLSDWQRVTRWILYVDEWGRLMRAVRRERLGTGSQGQTVLNPLWSALAQVESALQRAETDLGLGPASRLKLGMQVMENTKTIRDLIVDRERTEARAPSGFEEYVDPETGRVVIDLDKPIATPQPRPRPGWPGGVPDNAA